MALTKFVKNCEDLSDDGGYKFRFHCDKCQDGFETQYVSAATNMLKTAIDVFGLFRWAGNAGRVANSIDRGLRGKERDAAYEKAVSQAMTFFKKCTACGIWVCPEACWNADAGLCEGCAPNAVEEAAKTIAKQKANRAVKIVADRGVTSAPSISCPVCNTQTKGQAFCTKCGTNLKAKPGCAKCGTALEAGARFCGQCGAKAA